MSKPASQEVRAPFCLMPIRHVFNPAAFSPLAMALAPIGAAILSFGIWDLIHSLPDTGVPTLIILFGAALFWVGGVRTLRALRAPVVPVGYWIGCDSGKFLFANHDHIYSKSWTDIGTFRVRESTENKFVTSYKGEGLNDEINFVQTVSMTLSANTSDGPAIEIPFEHFINAEQDRRAAADNLCMFLNDVRHRALNGGLERGTPPFLAPLSLRIVPMNELPRKPVLQTKGNVGRPAVRRQD